MKEISIPPGYKPNDNEAFMSDEQLAYFRQKLHNWREELLKESSHTIHQLQDTSIPEPDIVDVASN